MHGSEGGSLQNVLSISTAANNRYLLHFNSLNSLTQWTAGIRLAMFEHATLQEAYTGSLIAGKGKLLNNIRTIMERSKFVHEDWARVRFGAGTPWRRCWCVISPPNEKDFQKAQKTLKKKSAYDRHVDIPKGDIKFYDSRKVTKKSRPIATISDAYAAYAIYPQSKPLIDQSTLVKLEGLITIHTNPETTTEGFVFVMPEVHPAVTGFEMMLRWLFPVFDTFGLYGRPNRLIADTLDQRGLMFAMPRDRRYGYLDILDVSGLIHTEGSQSWTERQWRKELKKLTGYRMNSADSGGGSPGSIGRARAGTTSRSSLNLNRGSGVRFDDGDSTHSSPVTRRGSPAPANEISMGPRRGDTGSPKGSGVLHKRSASDAHGYSRYQTETPSRLSHEMRRPDDFAEPPQPPLHGGALGQKPILERVNSEMEQESPPAINIEQEFEELKLTTSTLPPPTPVTNPPAFLHSPNSKPAHQPYQAPELRRANSAIDAATLHQLADATRPDNYQDRDQENHANVRIAANNNQRGLSADAYSRNKGLVNNVANGNRLPTIPGSPYVNDGAFSRSESHVVMGPPPVPVHRNPPSYDGTRDISPSNYSITSSGPLSPPIGSSQSISRKPLPIRPLPSQPPQPPADINEPSSPSSNGSLKDHLIDQEVLERILDNPSERASTMASESSVDYASTNRSASPKKSIEKPRAGRLKTVGDPDYTPRERSAGTGRFDNYHAEQNAGMPTVDFGPTYAYKPNPRPGTSGTITPGGFPAGADRQQDGTGRPSRLTPTEAQRNSYFGGRTSPGADAALSGHERNRSVAWQPAAGGRARSAEDPARQSLTPEQWVQYRAQLAASPVPPAHMSPPRTHSRQQSRSPLNQPLTGRSTPPTRRNSSGDWTQQQPGSRPHSRGANHMMNPPSPGGLLQTAQSHHLSAREQMHVSRATGTPLLNVDRKPVQGEDSGLIAALAAREREKQAIKEGIRGGMVQQAIVARQQQQQQVEMEAAMQAQYAQEQQAAQFQQQQQQQQQMGYGYAAPGYGQQRPMSQYSLGGMSTHPGAGVYAQAGGWTNPGFAPGQGGQQQQQQQQQTQSYGASFYRGQGQGQGQGQQTAAQQHANMQRRW